MTYLPEGLRSASTGTRFPTRVQSSMVSFTPAQWAMPMRCITALVDPPRAITTVMAFSNAFLVMMSRGRMFFLSRFRTAEPASSQSRVFSCDTAACADEFGKLMPKASMAEAMVLAVYMPPHEPAPGTATSATASTSSAEQAPAAFLPTASKMFTRSTSFPWSSPGKMVPP